MNWTLTYFPPGGGEVTKDFATWKLSKLVLECETFAIDKCTFTAPAQLVDADLMFAKYAWVVINKPDGSIYFRGIVGKTPRRKSGVIEEVQYEIWGPWYWLERLPFQMEWRSTNGIISTLITTTKSRIIIGQNIDGTKMDLGAMMKTVLDYLLVAAAAYVDPDTHLAAPFVPFQIGVMTPDTIVPFIEIKDMACASLLKEMAKFVPSCIERVDYTTTPPTMHFAQRATLAPVAIPILSCSLCEPELRLIGPAASAGCIVSSAYFESVARPENRAFVERWKRRFGADSDISVDGMSTFVCVMLLARAIRRAGSTDVGAVRRAAANYRYDSPQGPIWVDPDNNHCFLTPRLARSMLDYKFEIFWEADAPERPDPYLANLDLAALGATTEAGSGAMNKRPSYLRVVK